MRQGFPLQRFFAAPSRSICSSRAYRPVAGSVEVREFHSYVVDVGAMIFNMEIVSGHDSAPISPGGSTGLSATDAKGILADDLRQLRRKLNSSCQAPSEGGKILSV
jgi:hypothetical protein